MSANHIIAIYYEVISSKSPKRMQNLLEFFSSPSYKSTEIKAELKEYLRQHPVFFAEDETSAKEIYEDILSSLR